MAASTNQDTHNPDGTIKKGVKLNPTGKGGFGERPQDISPGGWKKENTISYQYHRFLNMTPTELEEWAKTPKDKRTVAMDIAYNRIVASRKSLQDVKEVTDRTEGRASQAIDITSNGNELHPATQLSDEELNARIEKYISRRNTNNRTT